MATQMGSESRKRDRGMNGGSAAEKERTGATSTEGTSEHGSRPGQDDRLQAAATGLAGQAGRTVEAQASTLMSKAGESLEQVARAMRDAGTNLREERPEIATYADTAAQRVDTAASYLREHDAREVIDTAQDYARRQPAVVVAGALAVGLLVGRFLRSGSPAHDGSSSRAAWRDYGSTADTMTDPSVGSTDAGARRSKTRTGS
jgi:ElaB/YqjD/DUF883 family membrane-anchored ribosome-binding protein